MCAFEDPQRGVVDFVDFSKRVFCFPSEKLPATVQDAARIGDVVGRVENVSLVKHRAVPLFEKLVIGGARDDLDLQLGNCPIVDHATESARRKDVCMHTEDLVRLDRVGAEFLDQTLRIPQALSYAAASDDEEKLVLISDVAAAGNRLPPGTEILSFDVGGSTLASMPGRAVGRAERWAKGGSTVGSRLARWMRAAEWRLRYVERIRSIMTHRRGQDLTGRQSVAKGALTAIAERQQIDEIVVFDLFVLPSALDFALSHGIPVKVR